MCDNMHSYNCFLDFVLFGFFCDFMFADLVQHVFLMFLINLKYCINLLVFLWNVFLKSKNNNNDNNSW